MPELGQYATYITNITDALEQLAQGTAWTDLWQTGAGYHLQPLLAPMVILPVLLLLAFLNYRRPYRLLVIACIALALLNPQYEQIDKQQQPDLALVLVDKSTSQQYGQRAEQLAAAEKWLQQELASYGDKLQTQWHYLESSENTLLLNELQQQLSKIEQKRLAAIFILTDGQLHDSTANLSALAAQEELAQIPLNVILTGSKQDLDDYLQLTHSPSYGVVGEKAIIRLRALQGKNGRYKNDIGNNDSTNTNTGSTTLTIVADNGERQQLELDYGKEHEVALPIKHGGSNSFQLAITQGEQELSHGNNFQLVTINAVRDQLKVLLVTGLPHMGERVWRDILKSDPNVNLVHFTILRSSSNDNSITSDELSLIPVPVHKMFASDIAQFDLIIFDHFVNYNVIMQHYFHNIARYVKNGGAFLEIAGANKDYSYLANTRLREIMAAEPIGDLSNYKFVPQASSIAKLHPVTKPLLFSQERWGEWYRYWPAQLIGSDIGSDIGNDQDNAAINSKATVLLNIDKNGERPLLVLSRQDQGRVGQLFSDQIWLWARNDNGPYQQLIRRLIYWLMAEPELEENKLELAVSDLSNSPSGNRQYKLAITLRSINELPQQAIVTSLERLANSMSENSNEVKVALAKQHNGLAKGELLLDKAGFYRVKAGELQKDILLGNSNSREQQEIIATPHKLSNTLQQLANMASDSDNRPADYLPYNLQQLWWEDGAPAIAYESNRLNGRMQETLPLKARQHYQINGYHVAELLPSYVYLLSALALLIFAWYREGTKAN